MLTSDQDEIQNVGSSLQASQDVSEPEQEVFSTPLRSLSPAGRDNALELSDSNLIQSPSVLRLSERLLAVEKELCKVKKDKQLEIDFWKDQYRKAQDERLRLKRSQNALMVKQSDLRGSELSVEEDLVKHQAYIDDLLTERHMREHVQNLKPHLDTRPDDLTISKVSKLMQDIGVRLETALEGADFAFMPDLRELPEDHLLRSPFEQAFGIEWNSPEALELLGGRRERSWLHQYGLLALCGAALACWVFQQTQADILFDGYQQVGTRSTTDRYRYAIELVGQHGTCKDV